MIKSILVTIFCLTAAYVSAQHDASRPNIILIMTDDQGYGDFGFTGNPYAHTPTIDRLAAEGTLFTNFYVSPVCAPTRSSLMTGKQSIRTGVYDTYNGGAIMDSREITIAEKLSQAGYATGIFGKWHLGDTYPNRPSEQGFQESLVHNAGGMAQVGDPNTYFEENSYFDATLWENNQLVKTKGYCSDVFTEAAIHFIEKNKDKSFFTYLPFNAPHTPLQVPDEYYAKYKDLPLESTVFSQKGYPMPSMTDKDREDARRVYAMVENIDDNVNRLLKKLEENGLMENTLIFFLTDNGPQQRRYTAGFRGTKGTVYEGGVRVPLIVYPRQNGQERINAPTAHMDIFPTIMNICQLNFQHDIDGISLTSLFQKNTQPFAERVIYHHWTRGYFTPYQNMAIRQGDYKLVGKVDYDAGIDEFELYNIINDPFEQNNMIHSLPEEAEKLKEKLDAWINDVVRNIKADPVIVIGDHHENPTLLNRNDAKGQPGIWAQDEIYGYWDIEVVTSGYYNFKYYFLHNLSGEGAIRLNLKPMEYTKQITSDTTKEITLRDIYIPAGRYRLETWYQPKNSVFILPFNIEILKKE